MLEIVYRKPDELKPYENNPRYNEEAVEVVMESIKEFGFKVPILIDEDDVIVAGHTRLKASKRLAMKEVPTIQIADLTEDQIKAFRLADNKVAEYAEWDLPRLELEILNIGMDLSPFGFELEDQLEEDTKTKENRKYLEQMEIKAFEHHDYIVFVFDNQMDWLNIVNEFGLKRVDAGYGKNVKIGLGRVINGKELVERLRHKNSDSK